LSIGNQADLTFAEYLEYLAEDTQTKAICLYVEGFQDGRHFYQTAKALAPRKPILLFKPGRTTTGARSSFGHTASLAVPDRLVDALCRQAGLIRAQESEHLLLMADAVATAGPASGRRVAIVSQAGAQCVIIADACDALGLELPVFDAVTQERLQQMLPPHCPPARNPIDFGGPGPDPVMVTEVLETVSKLDYIDGIIAQAPGVGSSENISERDRDLYERVKAIPQRYGKRLILTGGRNSYENPIMRGYREAGIPAFSGEDCARAMYALARYGGVQRWE
jgi:acetyltransferase